MRELRTFAVVYPCFALVHKDSIVCDPAGKPISYALPIKFMVLDDKSGNSTFPVFSDGGLASRFLKTMNDRADYKIVEVSSPKMLAEALEGCRGIADSMSFDQQQLGAKPYAIWPLEYAIQKIAGGEDL